MKDTAGDKFRDFIYPAVEAMVDTMMFLCNGCMGLMILFCLALVAPLWMPLLAWRKLTVKRGVNCARLI